MDRKTALKILNLKDNCTDEERKKAYQALVKLHHPDKYMYDSDDVKSFHEKAMQEINGANEFLINNKLIQFKSPYDPEGYADILNSEIYSYFTFFQKVDFKLVREIANAANPFLVPVFKDVYVSEAEMDKRISEFLQTLKVIYQKYQEEFFAKYNIPNPTKPLKYDVHVDDFYEELLSIKNKYVPEEIQEKGSNELYTLMRRMEQLRLVIKKALKKIKDPTFASLYKKINDHALSVPKEETLASLEQLANSIEEYQEKHTNALRSNEAEELLSTLTSRYNEAILLRNDNYKELDNIYQNIIAIFDLYSKDMITLSTLFALADISFIDLEKDNNIINTINSLISNENNNLELK